MIAAGALEPGALEPWGMKVGRTYSKYMY